MNSDLEERERGLLPYSVITKAVQGDPEAMMAVVRHYESYTYPAFPRESCGTSAAASATASTWTSGTACGPNSCGLSWLFMCSPLYPAGNASHGRAVDKRTFYHM